MANEKEGTAEHAEAATSVEAALALHLSNVLACVDGWLHAGLVDLDEDAPVVEQARELERAYRERCAGELLARWAAQDGEPEVESPPPKPGEKMGLWRKNGIRGGKYLVTRRDGTVPEWPNFVLGAKDPAAEEALRAYAREAEKLGFDARFVADVKVLADEFGSYRERWGEGDPDGAPHRQDDPATVAKMVRGANG